jgi:pimeloyl-ACP methyl ester carboxylesterase
MKDVQRVETRVGMHRVHSVHAGAGEPLVLLHGLSGSHRWWRHNFQDLAGSFRVHVPELVGFGASRAHGRRLGIDELRDVMADWLEKLDISRPHLMGHSMGGQIAIHLIAERDVAVRRLVLVASAGVPFEFTAAELVRFMAAALPPRAWGTPTFLPIIGLDAVRAGPRSLLRAGLTLLADDVTPLLARVTVPTLVVWGRLDPLLPVAHGNAIAAGIPGARLAVVEDAAHNVMADRPAEFNRLVLDFLRADA